MMESRNPGTGAILHNKLSSPRRKKPVEEVSEGLRASTVRLPLPSPLTPYSPLPQAVKIAEEKQIRAELHREERQRELARRLQMKTERMSQIKLKREETEIRRKQELQSKQAKANALRQSHLQEVWGWVLEVGGAF